MSDAQIEDLRRVVASSPGDTHARAALTAALRRVGLCPTHELPVGKRGTCKTCRTKRAAHLARQRKVKSLARIVYEDRQARREHPEGAFDSAQRWYPSAREDQCGDGSYTRPPSRSWPYSYMLRCRTLDHCRVLIRAGLRGEDVPDDVTTAIMDAGGAE